MKGLGEGLDEARALWPAFERLARAVPPTLVHGDFVPKNIRVLESDGISRAVPFDWGSGGYGFPAIDLAYVDPYEYWTGVRDSWHDLTLERTRALSSLGRLFRNLLLVFWLNDHAVSDRGSINEKLALYGKWIRAEIGLLKAVLA